MKSRTPLLYEEVRKKRREGFSLGEIIQELHVSQGSVSLWTEDIQLTESQLLEIERRRKNASTASRAKTFQRRRDEWKEEGRQHPITPEWIAGCMLYWAEGTKSQNHVTFVNTDPDMVKFFLSFLRKYFGLANEKIAMSIFCYTDFRTLEEIQAYWLQKLELEPSCLRKCYVDYDVRSTKKRKTKYPYGVCTVRTCSTEIAAKIRGAVEGFIGIQRTSWKDF